MLLRYKQVSVITYGLLHPLVGCSGCIKYCIPSASLSPVCPCLGFIEIGKLRKLQIWWRHELGHMGRNCLRSKCQSLRSLGTKMLKSFCAHIFVYPRLILHILSNTFHRRKCVILWYFSASLSVCHLTVSAASRFWVNLGYMTDRRTDGNTIVLIQVYFGHKAVRQQCTLAAGASRKSQYMLF